jgi:hypothetical protein
MEPPLQKSSQWLNITIIVCSVLMFGLIFLEGHVPGGTVHDALWSWHQQETASGPSRAELASAVILQAALIWFTFFSGNKRVTKGDKIAVSWMLGGASIAWLVMIVRHFLRP